MEKLWLESKPGQGSSLHFAARLQQCERSKQPPPDEADINGVRGQIIDNNTASLKILEEILRPRGMDLQTVANGNKAARCMREIGAATSHHPLVISDANIRGMKEAGLSRN